MFTFSFTFTALPSFETFDGFNLVHGEGFVGAGHHCWRFLLVLFQIQNNLLFLSLRFHTLNAWRCQRSSVKKYPISFAVGVCFYVLSNRLGAVTCNVWFVSKFGKSCCMALRNVWLHRAKTLLRGIVYMRVCVCVRVHVSMFFRTPTKTKYVYSAICMYIYIHIEMLAMDV